MALINRPERGIAVSDQVATCPDCGYPVKKMLERKAAEESPPAYFPNRVNSNGATIKLAIFKWKMKKKLTAVILSMLAVLVACSMVSVSAEEEPGKLALDMVIAIDISDSMSAGDTNGLRYDAAAMLIGLCDAEQSRVSIVPFGTSVYVNTYDYKNVPADSAGLYQAGNTLSITKYASKLYDVSLGPGNRSAFVSLLSDSDMRSQIGGATAMRKALMYAVNMLVSDPSGNKPVIVLLTGGTIQTGDNEAERTIFNNAVAKAKENGIAVYTVALKIGETEAASEQLQFASAQTGAMPTELVTAAEDLPGVFNKFFADLVDSETVELENETVENDDGSYTVSIAVPNESVAEMNILIPVGSYNSGSVALYKPDSEQKIEIDGTNYCQYQTPYFTFIKCIKPDTTGVWKVVYSSNARNKLGSGYIKAVFSYSVQPEILLDSDNISKSEPVEVSVRFVKTDGEYTDDSSIYTGGINAVMTISNDKGIVSEEEICFEKKSDRFSASFAPSDEINNLKSGSYTLTVDLKGDGMDAEVSREIYIENKAPEAQTITDNPFAYREIQDPTTEEYRNQFSATLDLNKLFTEPDNEKMTFTVTGNTGEVVTCGAIENGMLTMITTGSTGKGSVRVKATDPENGTAYIDIPVEIKNIRDYIANNYTLKFTGRTGEKGSDYTITAKLYDGQSVVTDESLLNLVDIGAILHKDYTNHADDSEALTFKRSGSEWTCTVTTSVNECAYSVTAKPGLSDISIAADVQACAFKLTNNAPQVTNANITAYTDITIHDPLTANYAQETEIKTDLNGYVADPDGQKLSFTVDSITGDQDAVSCNMQVGEDGILNFSTNDKTGSACFNITATDEDGAQVSFTIPVKVTSVRAGISANWMLKVEVDHEPEASNESYTYIAKLYNGEEQIKDEALLSLITIDATRTTVYENGKKDKNEDVEFARAEGESRFTASAKTGQDSATYTLTAKVLVRDIEILAQGCTVGNGNKPPESDKNVTAFSSVEIHDPFKTDYADEFKGSVDLNDYVVDPDGQALKFEIITEPDMTIAKAALSGGKLTVESNNAGGSTYIVVRATDPDNATLDIRIPVSFTCVRDAIKANYRVIVTGSTDEKSASYTYTAKLFSGNTQITDESILSAVTMHIFRSLSYTSDSFDDVTNEQLNIARNGSEWIAQASTNNHECSYTVSAAASIRDIELNTAGDSFTLKNAAPARNSKLATDSSNVEIHDPIGTTDAEYAREAEFSYLLSDYITDPDDEELTYEYAITDGNSSLIREARVNTDGTFTFATNNTSGECTVTVTATDPQGASAQLLIPVKVTDKSAVYRDSLSLVVKVDSIPTEKNAVYTYSARLYNNGMLVENAALLSQVEITAAVTRDFTSRTDTTESLSFSRAEGASVWTASSVTAIDECAYGATVNATLRGNNTLNVNTVGCEFKLNNRAPELKEDPVNPFADITINDPVPTGTNCAGEYDNKDNALDLYTFVQDPDTQTLEFSAMCSDNSIADVTVTGGSGLRVRTASKTGTAYVTVTATDPDGASVTFPIEINVFDRSDYIAQNYVLSFTAEDGADKNSSYKYSLALKDKTGKTIDDADALNELLKLGNNVYVEYGDTKLKLIGFDSGKMTVSCKTGDKKGTYTVKGTVKLDGIEIAVSDSGFTVANQPPYVDEQFASELPITAAIDPWLWAKENDTETVVEMGSLFCDTPTEVLTYSAVALPKAGKDTDTSLEARVAAYKAGRDSVNEAGEPVYTELEVAGGKLTISNTKKGTNEFLLTATDADGESVHYIYTLKVISQKANIIFMGIIALAGIVLIVIITLLVYWNIVRKSWSRRHGAVKMYVNGVPKPDITLPVRGKADRSLAILSVSSAFSDGFRASETRKLAGNYIMRAGKRGAVTVMGPKKADSKFKVDINGAPINAKQRRQWMPGGTLTVLYDNVKIEYRR